MKSENGGAGHVIGAMLERFREKELPVPGENEYIGENGLLFCSVCLRMWHMPVSTVACWRCVYSGADYRRGPQAENRQQKAKCGEGGP